MAHLLQELARNLVKVREDIWCYDGPEFISDDVLEKLLELHVQLKVQRALQTTAELLRKHPSNKSLPSKQATRVKHFIKFVFGTTARGNERQAQLRKLDCNALKFCGLAYKVKDVLELPSAEFDFLVANVADFIRCQRLLQYLYREDINKAVHGEFDPEDDDLFKKFLKSHVELRPAKRKRDESPPNTPPDATSDGQQAEPGGQAQLIQVVDSLSPSKEEREMKHMYTNAPASNISKLPEPFRTAVQKGRLWKWERSQGLETTGCFATLFPKDNTQDVSYTIWCGNNDGYHLNDIFGLQHAMSS